MHRAAVSSMTEYPDQAWPLRVSSIKIIAHKCRAAACGRTATDHRYDDGMS